MSFLKKSYEIFVNPNPDKDRKEELPELLGIVPYYTLGKVTFAGLAGTLFGLDRSTPENAAQDLEKSVKSMENARFSHSPESVKQDLANEAMLKSVIYANSFDLPSAETKAKEAGPSKLAGLITQAQALANFIGNEDTLANLRQYATKNLNLQM